MARTTFRSGPGTRPRPRRCCPTRAGHKIIAGGTSVPPSAIPHLTHASYGRHVLHPRPGDCRRTAAGRGLCAVFVRPHLDLGHDEHRQLRPWRFRHARHVCGVRGLDAARRRAVCWRAGCRPGAGDARHYRLFRADPQRHERADAGTNSRHLRAGAVAALFRVLGLWRQLHDAAGESCRRYLRRAGHPDSGVAPVGRRGGVAGDIRPAPAADAHLARLEDARGGRGFHRRATDGHPSRYHAGDRLGDCRRCDGNCRRADRNLLLYCADRRRDARHRRLRHGVARRFRQRAGRAGCGLADRRHRIGVGLLDRRGLQGHRGVFAVPVFPLVPAARPDGQVLMGKMRRLIWPSVALALVIAYPLLFSTPFQQRLGALILLYAIAASAWNVIGGYAGQVSVGHVVFFGCGAYAAMAAYSHFALPPLVGIPAGIFVSVLIAAVIGVPTLRLSGHYFSMATIAVAELVRLVVTNTEYLGAAVGLSGPTVPRTVLDLSFTSALPYYYLFLSLLVITLGITWWMANSRMGFYLRAIRDSERAARSLGAPASRTKLYAFMLSAGLTSVAGALYAMMFGFVDPESGLGILISVKILIMAALGGAGLLFGPLVGAAILVPLEEISNNLLGGKGAGLTFVLYGAIIVLIARFQPGGVLTLINRMLAKRRKAPETSVAAGATHAP